jgi:hypothetical protein
LNRVSYHGSHLECSSVIAYPLELAVVAYFSKPRYIEYKNLNITRPYYTWPQKIPSAGKGTPETIIRVMPLHEIYTWPVFTQLCIKEG